MVARAQEACDRAGAPEREACDRAVRAGQVLREAVTAERHLTEDGADAAALVEARMRVRAAHEVEGHEAGKLQDAVDALNAAAAGLDAARAGRSKAQEALDAAEAQAGAPLTGERGIAERVVAMLGIWPFRLAMKDQPGFELDATDLAICRWMCECAAAELGVVPAAAAARIRAEASRETAQQYRGIEIVMPGGGSTSVGAMLGAQAPGQGR